MWYRKTLALLPAFALVLAACGQQGDASPDAAATDGAETSAPATEQVLRVDLGGEPPTLDPNQATDSVSIAVISSIVRPLVWFNEELEAVPEGGLAESWELSEDGTEITFTIRADATYSDGTDITADDFVFGWRRMVDPRIAAGYGYVMSDLVGGEEALGATCLEIPAEDPPEDCDEESEVLTDEAIDTLLEGLGVEAVDAKTLHVTLVRPATYFLYIAALWVTAPVNQAWIESAGATEAENYLASGPFMMQTWDHESQIVLVPNPEWYGEAPGLSEIRMSMIPEPTQALAAYESGEIDMVRVPSPDIARIVADPALEDQISRGASFGIEYFGFDMAQGPTAESKALRLALSQSIDRQQLIDVAFGGLGVPADSSVPPGMFGHQPGIGVQYDPEAAQENLATALEDLGLSDASEITLELGYNTEAGHEPRVEFLQEQWRQSLGINVELVGLEWSAYLTQLGDDPFDIFRLGWGADYPHGFNFLKDLFITGGGNNNMKYSNPEFDEVLTAAAAEPDPDEQLALLNQAQEIMVEDAPAFFTRWGEGVTLTQTYVQGMVPTGLDGPHFPGSYFMDRITISGE